MNTLFANEYNLISLVSTLAIVIGGYTAFRLNLQQTCTGIEQRTREAMKQEIDTLKDKITDLKDHITELEKENVRSKQIIETIKSALKKKGLLISIDGDLLSIQDNAVSSTYTTRIRS
jgi:cell division protein FtsB